MLLYTSYDQREHRAADALTVYNWITKHKYHHHCLAALLRGDQHHTALAVINWHIVLTAAMVICNCRVTVYKTFDMMR